MLNYNFDSFLVAKFFVTFDALLLFVLREFSNRAAMFSLSAKSFFCSVSESLKVLDDSANIQF